MNPALLLERYILAHPDYWEFEEERREVQRLKELCKLEAQKQKVLDIQSYAQQQLYAC